MDNLMNKQIMKYIITNQACINHSWNDFNNINPLSTHCQRGAERNNTINAIAYNGP